MKCKAYSDEFKGQLLKEVVETGNVTLAARDHGIPSTTINTWIKKKSSNIYSRGPLKPEDLCVLDFPLFIIDNW